MGKFYDPKTKSCINLMLTDLNKNEDLKLIKN